MCAGRCQGGWGGREGGHAGVPRPTGPTTATNECFRWCVRGWRRGVGGGRVGGPVAADLVRDGGVVGAVPHGAAASGPRFTITWIFVMCKRGGVGGGAGVGALGWSQPPVSGRGVTLELEFFPGGLRARGRYPRVASDGARMTTGSAWDGGGWAGWVRGGFWEFCVPLFFPGILWLKGGLWIYM